MRRFAAGIIVVMLSILQIGAYNTIADSLEQELADAPPHERTAILYQLSAVYQHGQEYSTAMQHSLEAYENATTHQQWELAIEALTQISSIYTAQGSKDSTYIFLDKALEIAEKQQLPTSAIQVLHVKSKALLEDAQWEEGIQCARKALALSKETNDATSLSGSYIILGNAFLLVNNADSAQYYYEQELSVPQANTLQRAIVQMNLGILHDQQGHSDTALSFYLQGLQTARTIENTLYEANILANLGTFYDDRGDESTALTYYLEADDLMIAIGEKRRSAIIRYNLAQLFISQKRLTEAERYLDTVLNYSIENDFVEMEIRTHISQSHLYIARKNYQAATEILEDALEEHSFQMSKEVLAEMLSNLALVYFYTDRLDEAQQTAQSAYQTAQESKVTLNILKSLEVQSKVFLKKRAYTNALQVAEEGLAIAKEGGFLNNILPFIDAVIYSLDELNRPNEIIQYYDLYKTFSDSIHSIDKQKSLSLQILNLKEKEFEQIQSALALNQSQLALKEEQVARRNILIGGIFLISIVLLIFAGTYYYISAKVQEKNQQLRTRHSQIRAQNKDLERLSTEKEKLISIMAHDLRSPINNIISIGQLLQADDAITPEQQHSLSLMLRSANRSQELIEHLLQSQKEQKEQALTPAITICDELITYYRSRAQEKNINLILHNNLDQHQDVLIPPQSYHRLLDNLISNAIKFSRMGGEVAVTLSLSNHQLVTSVQDSGPGFTAADQQVLFTPYAQRTAKPTGDEYSIGLGLSIIKSLVDKLQGTITLDTSPTGSTFTIVLPAES